MEVQATNLDAFNFSQSPVAWDFFNDQSFVSGILGPLGSGKSVVSCLKIMRLATAQRPDKNGVRRSRWVIIRNTYPELRSTTIKTWLDTFPENKYGAIVHSHPITHHIRQPTGRTLMNLSTSKEVKEWIDVEVMFLALDRPGDVKHLKSLEVTGAWINEATEVPEAIMEMLTGRVGRYPKFADGGCTWQGIILDTNASDDENWYYQYMRGDNPEIVFEAEDGQVYEITWEWFHQPPAVLEVKSDGGYFRLGEAGMDKRAIEPLKVLSGGGRYWTVNPEAENINNLSPVYYQQQIANKTLSWIQRYLQAKTAFIAPGKPWVPEFSAEVMVREVQLDRDRPLLAGIDCGGGTLNPAATFGQLGEFGDWRTISELTVPDIGIDRFSTMFHQHHAEFFRDHPVQTAWIDPAGRGRDEVYETAVEEHLRSKGIPAFCAPTNDPEARREALALPMGRLITKSNGETLPGFLIHPRCKNLIAGLGGKWYRRRVQIGGPERYVIKPEKNFYSHVGDAESYMLSGGGEHQILTRGRGAMGVKSPTEAWRVIEQKGEPVNAKTDFDVHET